MRNIAYQELGKHLEELENIMTCARWLINELEQLNYYSIAQLFQCAVEDAEFWIAHMADTAKKLPEIFESEIQKKEAYTIHKLLIKYAAISNPSTRENLIKKMMKHMEEFSEEK